MKTVTAHQGQSIFDIAIQWGGDVAWAITVAKLNGLSVTESLVPGQQVEIPDQPANREVFSYYYRKGLVPATSITTEFDAVENEGLDYWIVEVDFIIT